MSRIYCVEVEGLELRDASQGFAWVLAEVRGRRPEPSVLSEEGIAGEQVPTHEEAYAPLRVSRHVDDLHASTSWYDLAVLELVVDRHPGGFLYGLCLRTMGSDLETASFLERPQPLDVVPMAVGQDAQIYRLRLHTKPLCGLDHIACAPS